MSEQEGIWGLVMKPRWFLRWLPIDWIDEKLCGLFTLEWDGKHFPQLPRWFRTWHRFAYRPEWEWEPLEDESE